VINSTKQYSYSHLLFSLRTLIANSGRPLNYLSHPAIQNLNALLLLCMRVRYLIVSIILNLDKFGFKMNSVLEDFLLTHYINFKFVLAFSNCSICYSIQSKQRSYK